MFKKLMFSLIGAATALAIGAAGAYFTAQVTAPDSMIRAGSVAISTLPTSSPLAIDALAPGTSVITAKKVSGITDFYDALECTVTCGEEPLYAGSFSAMRTLPLRLAPGARGELRFEVGLPADAPNTLASDYTKVTLYVNAEQAH